MCAFESQGLAALINIGIQSLSASAAAKLRVPAQLINTSIIDLLAP
jgi:hypothetical protein